MDNVKIVRTARKSLALVLVPPPPPPPPVYIRFLRNHEQLL